MWGFNGSVLAGSGSRRKTPVSPTLGQQASLVDTGVLPGNTLMRILATRCITSDTPFFITIYGRIGISFYMETEQWLRFVLVNFFFTSKIIRVRSSYTLVYSMV